MLSTDAQSQSDIANTDGVNCGTFIVSACANGTLPFVSQKVTISTCHSAKGLEWPIVMIPAGM